MVVVVLKLQKFGTLTECGGGGFFVFHRFIMNIRFSSIPCVDVSVSSCRNTESDGTSWLLVILLLLLLLLLLLCSNTTHTRLRPCMEGVRAESCNRASIIAPGSAACSSKQSVRAFRSQFRSMDHSSNSVCSFNSKRFTHANSWFS